MSKHYSFFEACRENTGSHFLDSGGAYGRAWQCPPIKPTDPAVTWRDCVSIETAHFLDEHLEINADLQRQWEKWDDKNGEDLNWFDSGEKFMESLGLECAARDNVYNHDYDLSQVYVWEVWTKPGSADWLYDETAITVIYIHTGCDVRGGYTRPYFCRSNGDYPIPTDVVAQFHCLEARRTTRDPQDIDEKWACGYSSWPLGQVQEDVERWFEFTRKENEATVCALLKTGELVKIQADMPY